jgi:hypothetical protein
VSLGEASRHLGHSSIVSLIPQQDLQWQVQRKLSPWCALATSNSSLLVSYTPSGYQVLLLKDTWCILSNSYSIGKTMANVLTLNIEAAQPGIRQPIIISELNVTSTNIDNGLRCFLSCFLTVIFWCPSISIDTNEETKLAIIRNLNVVIL